MQPVWDKQIDYAACNSQFAAKDRLKAEICNGGRGDLYANGIYLIGILDAYIQQAQDCWNVQKQFPVKQRVGIPIAAFCGGVQAHRELAVPQALRNALNTFQMVYAVCTAQVYPFHHQGGAGKYHCTA